MTQAEIEGHAKLLRNSIDEAKEYYERGRELLGEEVLDAVLESSKAFTDKLLKEQEGLGEWNPSHSPKYSYTTQCWVETTAERWAAALKIGETHGNTPMTYLVEKALQTLMAKGGFPAFNETSKALNYKDFDERRVIAVHEGFKETIWSEAYRLSVQTSEHYTLSELMNYLLTKLEDLLPPDYVVKSNTTFPKLKDVLRAALKPS